jgi:Tfp pilus assembly protein PilN
MKAVNLLPPESRGVTKVAAAAPATGGDATGAFMVLGVLAACVVALAGYVLSTNTVKERNTELATATAQAAQSAKVVAELKPYADFQTTVNARVQTLRDLATSRFDWEQALRDLSRALPADVTLTALKGTISSTTASGGGASDPLRAALDVPAIELTGCAHSQPAVAQLMSRLRTVDGVTRVSLSKSDKEATLNSSTPAASGTGQSYSLCGKGAPPAFSIVAFFERAADAAAATTLPGSGSTPTTGTTPATGTSQPASTTGATTPATTGAAK